MDEVGHKMINIMIEVWYYFIPTLFVISTIANCLCVFVPHRTEMKNMISRYYFISMTITNEIWIIFSGINWLDQRLGNPMLMNEFCSLSFYIPTALRFLSMYFVLGFMIDRYNAIRFPQRQQEIRKTIIIIFGITIIGFVLAAFMFFVPRYHCSIMYDVKHWSIVIVIFTAIIIDIVPFITTIILTIRIFTMIRESRAVRSVSTNVTNGTNGTDPTSAISVGQQSSNMSVKEIRITKMLTILGVAYVSISPVANFLFILVLIETELRSIFIAIFLTVNIFMYTSLGMNLFVCCIVNQDFRQATLAMIRCRRKPYSTVQQTVLYTRVNPESNATSLMTSTDA